MPQAANTNWYNAHNFYGDLKDIEAATLDEVQSFFKTYYSPNNAALVETGSFEPAQAKAMVEKYFGGIPAAKLPPPPDLSEPPQTQETRVTRSDALATRPALAFAYHMPPRNSPEYYALGLLDQMLLQGDDSLLYQELVKKRGYTGRVSGGINAELGDMFDYNGPMLWAASLIHDPAVKSDDILSAVDSVVDNLREKPVPQALLDRSIVKMRSSLYDSMMQFSGFGKANLLACFALFDDDPARINTLEANFRKVTPAVLQRTAQQYLQKQNRTVLLLEPGAAGKK